MKQKILIASLALLAGAAIGGWLFGPGGSDSGAAKKTPAAKAQPDSWTCSMHPNIKQPDSGKCPICAMALVPVGSSAALGPRQFAMSPEARELARIATSPVERRLAEAEIRLVGKIDYDETRLKTVSARFPARIDRLYVDYTGIAVKKGDHLAHVYSPELLGAQRELLLAISGRGNAGLIRDKLRLWGLSDGKIRGIEKNGKPSDQMDIDSPAGGVVIEKLVNEGDYLEEGTPLFRIADLSRVWIQLDAYESDLPWLRYGQPVTFEAEAVPGRKFEGILAFTSRALDPATRTVKIRVHAENPGEILKPGMFVRAITTSTLAAGGQVVAPDLKDKWISPMHPEVISDEPGNCPVCGMKLVRAEDIGYTIAEPDPDSIPLVVPRSAVLRTGKRAVVYLEIPGADQPTYEGRDIVLGPRAGDFFLVESGLEEGDRVVTEGAFKIDSALQILAKPSMMSGDGEDELDWDDWTLTQEQFDTILENYLALQRALASDDFPKSKSAAKDLAGVIELQRLHEATFSIAEDESIKASRKTFETLSNALIAIAIDRGFTLPDSLYEAHCPMAFDYKGASWLQRGEEIFNPYFGAEMLHCGTAKKPEPRTSPTPPGHSHHQH